LYLVIEIMNTKTPNARVGGFDEIKQLITE